MGLHQTIPPDPIGTMELLHELAVVGEEGLGDGVEYHGPLVR
jgi:hypothetical protein